MEGMEETQKKEEAPLIQNYWNGRWTTEPITVPANDLAVMRGYGAFDFLCTFNGKPFLMEEHLQRFENTARLMKIPFTRSVEELKELVHEGIRRNSHMKEFYIKVVLTGGISPDSKATTLGTPSFFMVFLKPSPTSQHFYKEGLKIISYSHERFLPNAKSLSYMPGMIALQQAAEKAADEVVFLDREGNFLEGPTWSFFLVVDGTIVEAPEDRVLPGITAMFVREAANELQIPYERRTFNIKDVGRANEAFATSTTRGVMPITSLDGEKIGDGAVGPVTSALMQAFEKRTQQH
ncbi:Dalanine aminotransferase [Balamuthia mandrillaris]